MGNRSRRIPPISMFENPREADRLRLMLEARPAMGQWLGKFGWNHWGTFTFGYPSSVEGVMRQRHRLIRRLEERARGPVPSFWVMERGAVGWPHLHLLLQGTGKLLASDVEDSWPCGRADVDRYDPQRGATHYITKCVGSDVIEYDIDSRCRLLSQINDFR